jgi:hypothetical protein
VFGSLYLAYAQNRCHRLKVVGIFCRQAFLYSAETGVVPGPEQSGKEFLLEIADQLR